MRTAIKSRRGSFFLAFFLAAHVSVLQSQNVPRVGYVYPAGGCQGSAFQVTVGGQFLEGVTNVSFSGTGIKGAIIEYTKPLTQMQFAALKDQLKELQDKKAAAAQKTSTNSWTEADDRLLAEVKMKLSNPPNRLGNPAIAERVKVQVTMATNAEPGQRELRLESLQGVSNPRFFHVGELPEFSEEPSKNIEGAGGRSSTNETSITLPITVNGQIMPGGADRYRFKAAKGEHLVIAVSARELIPYLPDAVPGWFQASVTLYDAQGRELEQADHFRFHPDPVLYYEIQKDGDYLVEIRDSIYRGREDFIYRIALGQLPFITSIFPLGGASGTKTRVELKGWNLPVATITQDSTDNRTGIFPISLRNEKLLSNFAPFAVDALPECLEKEPNHDIENAQRVTLPIIVNGRIERPGEWDVFRFEGQGGAPIVAEVLARRLNSPLDSVLKITDSTGKQLAFNDDSEDKGSGLDTHHADSRISMTLPKDGTYYVHLGDAQQNGGLEYAYRLRISPPQPDFALRIVPSAINVRGGATIPLTVYALRKDGFSNEIEVVLKNAPEGFTLSGGKVPPMLEKIQLTLTVPPTALAAPLSLDMEGRSTLLGRPLVHPAIPAEDMMQAFAYRHLVPAKELKVWITSRNIVKARFKLLGQGPVKIPSGGAASVQFSGPKAFTENVHLDLSEPPDGLVVQKVSAIRDGFEIMFQADAAKIKPGLKGNLIVSTFPKNQPAAGKAKGQKSVRQNATGALPAIPFEIIQPK